MRGVNKPQASDRPAIILVGRGAPSEPCVKRGGENNCRKQGSDCGTPSCTDFSNPQSGKHR